MKEQQRNNPTPWLGKPNSRSQVFTVHENKLLDQMTLEINEAWRKDLTMMRSQYKRVIQTAEELKNITDLMEEKFPALNEFIATNPCLITLSDTLEMLKEKFFSLKGELIHEISSIKTRDTSEFTSVKHMIDSLSVIIKRQSLEIQMLQKEMKKPWWKRIFG